MHLLPSSLWCVLHDCIAIAGVSGYVGMSVFSESMADDHIEQSCLVANMHDASCVECICDIVVYSAEEDCELHIFSGVWFSAAYSDISVNDAAMKHICYL